MKGADLTPHGYFIVYVILENRKEKKEVQLFSKMQILS